MRYTFGRAAAAAAGVVMGAAFGAAVVYSVAIAADLVIARFPDPLYRGRADFGTAMRAAGGGLGADVDEREG